MRIVVGFAAGGGADITARLTGQWLSERLGQQFVIENRPGAVGNIATEAVVNAPPDGYTLLLVNAANAINATLYDKLSFNFIRDIAPVASITRESLVMALHPSVPAKTVSELIAYAKANPGKLSMGSGGNGSTSHVAGELFKMMTGVNMVHVPYRSIGLALADLIGGQVQVAFGGMTASSEHIKTGKLRLLAVTTATRSEALPDIPTIGDFVPGYETSNWFGIGAPRNTPVGIIERLNREINAGLADPRLKARLTDTGATVYAGLPADFGKFMSEETEKWGKVIRAANTRGVGDAMRIPANKKLEVAIEDVLFRSPGRPSRKPLVRYKSFHYQADSWTTARRVVAKVEHHAGELFPRVGLIVTNLTLPNRAVVRFYNKRGTAEQWIKEGKQAAHWTRLSCHRFRANEVRLQLSVLAYNLGNLWRRLVLPRRIERWSLTSLQQRLVKTGGRLVTHARYYWLLLAESHLTRQLFGSMLQRI